MMHRILALTALLLGLSASCGQLPPASKSPNKPANADDAEGSDLADPTDSTGNSLTTRPDQKSLRGSYIVTFKDDLAGHSLDTASWLSEYKTYYGAITGKVGGDPRVVDVNYIATVNLQPDDGESTSNGWFFLGQKMAYGLPLFDFQRQEPLSGVIARVDFADNEVGDLVLKEWQESGLTYFSELNNIGELEQDTPTPDNIFKRLANEYESTGGQRWWLEKIKLSKAFEALGSRDQLDPTTLSDAALGSTPPIIAVFDSGVDYKHPALSERIWTNPSQNSAGCKGDAHGCDTTTARKGDLGTGNVHPFGTDEAGVSCPPGLANCSHGTHVAGLIVADHLWSDPSGRAPGGACPVCKIMSIRVVSKTESGSGILDSSLLAGFQYVQRFRKASGTRVRVINCSFGKFTRSRAVALLMRSLRRDGPGTLIVAASGNEDTLAMEFPAAYTDSVAVSAVDSGLRKTVYSNFGRWVDISAPGHMLLSTVPGGALEEKPGTSMAAPLVAGVAGLMLVKNPSISFAELRKWLVESADPVIYDQSIDGGYNFNHYYPKIKGESARLPLLGFGLLNAENAVLKKNSGELPIYNKLDRVEPGCSVLRTNHYLKGPLHPYSTILLMLPLLTVLFSLIATHAIKLIKPRKT